jgi:phosphoribosylamine--glycine ligase
MANKVLIVGSGGREHALGWKLAQSGQVSKLFFAPGNGGTSQIGVNVPIEMTDVENLFKFAKKTAIDFTVIGQEAALEAGIVDRFKSAGLKIFGPTKSAAQIETSKAFSSEFFERHNIPRPKATTAHTLAEAKAYLKAHKPSEYVIKADGLATGKGVVLPKTQIEADQTVQKMMSGELFGDSGKLIVFQERLSGQEVSAFALSDGRKIVMLPFFQDHKPIFDGDKGPNTGGMGAYTPVPIVTKELAEEIRTKIMQAAIDGLAADGMPYQGVLYAGLFITEQGPKVIEFNARFGDPECQPMMQMIDDDWHDLLDQSAQAKLINSKAKVKPGASVTVAIASGGYPGDYKKGLRITGIEEAEEDPDVVVFHAGTAEKDGQIVTNGGRVLNVTAYGRDLKAAIDKAYKAVKKIHFEGMQYRSDIGAKALV